MTIYMDNAATTSVSETALAAMLPALRENYGNPSSLHELGQRSSAALEEARESVARCLGAQPREIYFTSGGTEADNWAIRQLARQGAARGKKHLITTAFEHHAVLHTMARLEKDGFEVTYLDVHEDGLVRPEELEAALRDDTALVSIMLANNEIGTIQPIRALAELCHAHKVPIHTDAVQAVGHIPVNVDELGVDLLSLSGHKFHGPKGVGALYCRRSLRLTPLLEGGAQERNRRPGTENLPGILGMAAALREATEHLEEHMAHVTALRDALLTGIADIPCTRVNGSVEHRLPGNVNVCFEGIEGESLLLRLDLAGICASSGSACTSGSLDPSHVLLAIGLPKEVAHGSLRLSLDAQNTREEVDYTLEQLPRIVQTLRDLSPVWEQMKAEGRC